jgi:hypothetical protein
MPRLTPPSEWDHIVAAVAAAPQGLSVQDLMAAGLVRGERRTAQRRLQALVTEGRLTAEGRGPATRYVMAGDASTSGSGRSVADALSMIRAPHSVYVPLSEEAIALREWVQQPLGARTPIGYQAAFLDQYQPNQSAYLPPATRIQLHEIGRSPAVDAPAGTFARDILNRLLIDLSYASSRLEGNHYSRADTERLLDSGTAAPGASALDTQMILNHKAAIEYLVYQPQPTTLDARLLKPLHALLTDGLLPNPDDCGRLRRVPIGISGSVYHPLALPQPIESLLDTVLRMANAIEDPFEQSFFLLVHVPYLQPFIDGNQRLARLAANVPFFRHNLCPLSFLDLPTDLTVAAQLAVYELNRIDLLRDLFVWAYARSCQQYVALPQEMVMPDEFRLHYRQELRTVIARIVQEQLDPQETILRSLVPSSMRADDVEAFVRLVQRELKSLNPDNVVRFGVRPIEFELWKRLKAR